MSYDEIEIRKAIAILEVFTVCNPVIIKAKTLLELSSFHAPHFEIKKRYRNEAYFNRSCRAIRALKESKLETPLDLVDFCNAKGIEGLARLSRVRIGVTQKLKSFCASFVNKTSDNNSYFRLINNNA